jgi:integrase/recombinase XerD
MTLVDLHGWAASLVALSPATRARRIGAATSLLSFAQLIGYLPFNVGAALRAPPIRGVLAERIPEEADAIKLIALEPDPRNHAVLRLGYPAATRRKCTISMLWSLRSSIESAAEAS